MHAHVPIWRGAAQSNFAHADLAIKAHAGGMLISSCVGVVCRTLMGEYVIIAARECSSIGRRSFCMHDQYSGDVGCVLQPWQLPFQLSPCSSHPPSTVSTAPLDLAFESCMQGWPSQCVWRVDFMAARCRSSWRRGGTHHCGHAAPDASGPPRGGFHGAAHLAAQQLVRSVTSLPR